MDEIKYSVGATQYSDELYNTLTISLLKMGDVIIDGIDLNKLIERKKTIRLLRNIDVGIYAYVMKRPIEDCLDGDYTKDEIIASSNIDFPKLSEGLTKVMTVRWDRTVETISYGGESIAAKPIITVVEEVNKDRLTVVKPKKRKIKRKLERGRQNLFRPNKNI